MGNISNIKGGTTPEKQTLKSDPGGRSKKDNFIERRFSRAEVRIKYLTSENEL